MWHTSLSTLIMLSGRRRCTFKRYASSKAQAKPWSKAMRFQAACSLACSWGFMRLTLNMLNILNLSRVVTCDLSSPVSEGLECSRSGRWGTAKLRFVENQSNGKGHSCSCCQILSSSRVLLCVIHFLCRACATIAVWYNCVLHYLLVFLKRMELLERTGWESSVEVEDPNTNWIGPSTNRIETEWDSEPFQISILVAIFALWGPPCSWVRSCKLCKEAGLHGLHGLRCHAMSIASIVSIVWIVSRFILQTPTDSFTAHACTSIRVLNIFQSESSILTHAVAAQQTMHRD